ncbi:MAG: diaminopimelate decarboxylase [SAR86 cluster bacterium]|jgi:diaminopimelate decarboxylase|nr:MAG: diaminopimelate decarboxylase [SAR86 cluster bacterium]|tara:strand:+ start:1510 stop:2748 length:1239 start_codon:yes stop_codon:yes gene_type:complete
MDFFEYKKDELFCEEVNLIEIAENFGTPTYVYSSKTLNLHIDAYMDSFTSKDYQICFSVKSLSNIAILNILKNKGCGFDIVSGGELHRAISVGADPKSIIFSGVGKSKNEIEDGILNEILSFNIESKAELKKIETVASNLKKIAPVSIRFNPDIDSGGHDYITTGRKGDKFGINNLDETIELAKYIRDSKNLEMVGLACHIGSQILNLKSYEMASKKTIDLATKINKLGIDLQFFDMGGGLGVPYLDESPPHPKELISMLEEVFVNRNEKLILEPGRSISANAGVLLTKVEYIKDNFAIVDAAMNDLIRPALYGAKHDIWNLKNKTNAMKKYNVVGPICESSDFLGKDILLDIAEDDLLCIKTAGAYGFVMSSNYNSRLRSAEVLVDGKTFNLIRRRENIQDLIGMETIPND